MKVFFLILTTAIFSINASADSVKCGTSSYYAFSKCSKSKKKRHLKKLYSNDLSTAFQFIRLLEEERKLSFAGELKKVNQVLGFSKNYLSKLSLNKDVSFSDSLSEENREDLLVFVSDCKLAKACDSEKSNALIDHILLDKRSNTNKLASEVKDAKSI